MTTATGAERTDRPDEHAKARTARSLAGELRATWRDRHQSDGHAPLTGMGDPARTVAGDVVDSEWFAERIREAKAEAVREAAAEADGHASGTREDTGNWLRDLADRLYGASEEAAASEIEDGFGGCWQTCGAGCDLQVVRPGKVQCNRTSTDCPDRLEQASDEVTDA